MLVAMAKKLPAGELAALGEARDRAIAQLSEAFAHDVIDVDEFERRITRAHAASTAIEIQITVEDLPGASLPVAWTPAIVPLAPPANDSVQRIRAVFGGVERHGTWTLPQRVEALALWGGMVLDFRDAVLSAGVTEVHVSAIMGGIQIIVPPTLSVEIAGTAIMGGFDHVERVPEVRDPRRPILRVQGVAFMGGVSIETRLPGESEREAHRRRKHERKVLARGHEPKRLVGRS
jgi:hypothetical protein